ncbi:hypothetical protein BDV24DRAFT_125835 [Aspergillus arachidicola]|uniref:Uncharacterized protein n=1 Tax=Aspergillus arachidicola TaxID=656916 RepID=A0A5N6YLG3_9EURO|nr:hypothetical protein BDV24DRAFT_125835 [Aspergillus arachidicola]
MFREGCFLGSFGIFFPLIFLFLLESFCWFLVVYLGVSVLLEIVWLVLGTCRVSFGCGFYSCRCGFIEGGCDLYVCLS